MKLAAAALLAGLAAAALSASALAAPPEGWRLEARVLAEGPAPKRLLFRQVVQATPVDDRLELTSEYRDEEGRVVVREKATLEQGLVRSYRADLLQIEEVSSVEVVGGEARFHDEFEGKVRENTETLDGELLLPLTLPSFLKRRWAELLEGKTITGRLALVERRETIGVKAKKVADNGDVVVVRIRPQAFLIAMLVEPVDVRLSRADARPISYHGRVVPRLKQGEKFVDVDADVIFDAPK
jgi:hypothetical protein